MGRRGSRIALTRGYKKLHTEVAVLRLSIRGLGDNFRIVGKNEAACAADAAREVVERWLPKG